MPLLPEVRYYPEGYHTIALILVLRIDDGRKFRPGILLGFRSCIHTYCSQHRINVYGPKDFQQFATLENYADFKMPMNLSCVDCKRSKWTSMSSRMAIEQGSKRRLVSLSIFHQVNVVEQKKTSSEIQDLLLMHS